MENPKKGRIFVRAREGQYGGGKVVFTTSSRVQFGSDGIILFENDIPRPLFQTLFWGFGRFFPRNTCRAKNHKKHIYMYARVRVILIIHAARVRVRNIIMRIMRLRKSQSPYQISRNVAFENFFPVRTFSRKVQWLFVSDSAESECKTYWRSTKTAAGIS